MKLTLLRFQATNVATHGVMLVDDRPCCFTLELPWKNNKKRVSSIPAGTYAIRAVPNAKWGEILRLEGVPKRDGILVHPGNSTSEIEGCILVGERFESVTWISESRSALKRLLFRMHAGGRAAEGEIEIRDVA